MTWNKINLTFSPSSPLQAGSGDRPVLDGSHTRRSTNTALNRCDLDGVKGSVEDHWLVLGRPLYHTFVAGERNTEAENKTLQQFDLRPVEYCRHQPVIGGKENAYGTTCQCSTRIEIRTNGLRKQLKFAADVPQRMGK